MAISSPALEPRQEDGRTAPILRGHGPSDATASADIGTLRKSINCKGGRTARIMVRRKSMLHEIRHPVVPIIHFNVAIRMLIRLIKDDYVANLGNVRILWHRLCSMPQ